MSPADELRERSEKAAPGALFDCTPAEMQLMNGISAAILAAYPPSDRPLFSTRYRAARAAIDVLRQRDANVARWGGAS